MKKTKWILTACIVIGIATASYAQQGQKDPAQMAKSLQTQLKLTDAQTTKITAIYQDIQQKNANDKVTQEKIKTWQANHDMKSILGYALQQMDANKVRVEAILTPDQKKSYEAALAQQRAAIQKLIDSQQ